MAMVHLLLKLSISTRNTIDFHLQLLTFIRLGFHVSFHLIDFLLTLSDSILSFVNFVLKIVYGIVLQVNFPLRFLDLILKAFNNHVLRFGAIYCVRSALHCNFLIFTVLKF